MAILRIIFLYLLFIITPQLAQGALNIGTLPAASSIILHVAIDEGIFKEQGLDINLIPFRSTVELTSAMRSGMLDGQFTDIVTVLMQNETGVPQQIVAVAARSTPYHRNFGIAVPSSSSIQEPIELKNVSIAISRATIIEFLLTKLLQKAHIPPTDCNILDINRIALRAQMLIAGKVDSALLVEPLLSLAEKKGAKVLIDDKNLDIVFAVIALTKKNATTNIAHPFRKALLEAARRINAKPDTYRNLMLQKGILPKEIATTFSMPIFDIEKHPIPTPKDIEDFTTWMLSSKLLQSYPKYEAVVLQ